MLNVPLLLSASVDNIWLSDLRDGACRAFNAPSAALLCGVCVNEGLLSPTYVRASSHACMQPPGETPDMGPHVRSSSHSPLPSGLSVPGLKKPAHKNRILTQCKLPSVPQLLPAFPTPHPCISLQPQIWNVSSMGGWIGVRNVCEKCGTLCSS